MNEITTFPSDSSLQELSELTEEVFFAFHIPENRIIFLNAAFEDVWNLTREAVISDFSLLVESVHPDDRMHIVESFAALQEDKEKRNIEFRLQQPQQPQKWIRVNAFMSSKSNTGIIVGTAEDITDYKDYSETLHKFSDKKNSILQILSHDLLGPLGNIQMSASMLADYLEEKPDMAISELLGLITQSSKKSVDMIRDLINKEFLQSSQAKLTKQRADIVAKIRGLIDQYKQTPRSIKQRFELITSVKSLFITMDEAKFIQVITNLLSNALKFTPEDGNITVYIKDQGKNVLIKIQDDGIGIPEDLQPFLFDKFTIAKRPGILGEPTTGLGMSIIKTIVEWHNGRIWFESAEGKGTTFSIEIPKEN